MEGKMTERVVVPVTRGLGAGCGAGRRQTVHIKRWAALYGMCQGRAYE